MSAQIHPTAIIDPAAHIGAEVVVGPYCIIGADVVLGDGCHLQHHVTVLGPSKIGARNHFYAYCSIGQQTQDLKYADEPTWLIMGEGNTFREHCTVNRGTASGDATTVGSGGTFLAYSHIAHDCTVGDGVIFSNNGTLAGHVTVGDYAVIGGLTAIHQFCRIGKHALTGGCSKIVQDVPPYMIADGNPAKVRGVNIVGLQRHGFSEDDVRQVKEAYRIIYRGGFNASQALERIRESLTQIPAIEHLLDFLSTSERGIIR